MAHHRVEIAVVDGKVKCSPGELHVGLGHTIEFGPHPHTGRFRGRVQSASAVQVATAGYSEEALTDAVLHTGVSPCLEAEWKDQQHLTIHPQAEPGAYAYLITVQTPAGPVDSDPVIIVDQGPSGG